MYLSMKEQFLKFDRAIPIVVDLCRLLLKYVELTSFFLIEVIVVSNMWIKNVDLTEWSRFWSFRCQVTTVLLYTIYLKLEPVWNTLLCLNFKRVLNHLNSTTSFLWHFYCLSVSLTIKRKEKGKFKCLYLIEKKMHPILKAFLHMLKFRLKNKYTGIQRMIGSYKKISVLQEMLTL